MLYVLLILELSRSSFAFLEFFCWNWFLKMLLRRFWFAVRTEALESASTWESLAWSLFSSALDLQI